MDARRLSFEIDRNVRLWLNAALDCAVSSAVEHCLHTAGVTGSIPVPRTNQASESTFVCPGKHNFATWQRYASKIERQGYAST